MYATCRLSIGRFLSWRLRRCTLHSSDVGEKEDGASQQGSRGGQVERVGREPALCGLWLIEFT
eukprot:2850545-Prymnesium_polylepis.1